MLLSSRTLAFTLVALAAGAAFTGPALADKAAADQCAAGLTKDGKAIYAASLPSLTAGTDLRVLLTTQTRSLAMAGTIAKGSAKANAEAAGACLAQAN